MDLVTLLGLVVPALFGTGILTWVVRGRIDEARHVREKLRAEQRERYAQILNPYVQLFADPKAQDEVLQVITSQAYRKETFDFALVADDSVLKAYIAMFDRFQQLGANRSTEQMVESLRAFGRVLIELRKSVGNKKTKLSELDVLTIIGVRDVEQYLGPSEAGRA